MVSSTEAKWSGASLGKVSHVRDSLGRITDLVRQYGMYSLYEGAGIGQDFEYTSKGELETAVTATIATPTLPILGRSLELAYDGQGNRKTLHVDGALSHNYTPGPANEYTAISYGEHVGSVSGIAVSPGTVVVGKARAERQGALFYRGFTPKSSASWTIEDVFAAAKPAPGNYVEQYAQAEKELYLPPASVTPQYDAAGNLKADGWWTYNYDAENRLIHQTSVAASPSGSHRKLSFAYDYLGRRVRKTVTAVEGGDSWTLSDTAFTYWDWHLLAEINLGGSASIKRHYVWGLDKEGVRPGAGGVGGLLIVADYAGMTSYLAINDYLGNVTGLVNATNGSIDAIYEYDPFGRPIRETGTYAAENPIRFSSQYTDNETGLVYFGFRYYHPEWGRFLNRDPIEEAGGENLYRFVSNDPVNRWDLLGLSTQGSGWRIDEWRRAVGIRTGGIIDYDNPPSGRSSGRVSQTREQSTSSESGSNAGEPSAGQAQQNQQAQGNEQEQPVRSGFATPDEAAIAASIEARRLTASDPAKDRREYGGEIYQYDEDGVPRYGYNEPRRGGPPVIHQGKSYNPGPVIRSDMVPSGTSFVGGYHSHTRNNSFSDRDRGEVRESPDVLYVGHGRNGNNKGLIVGKLVPTRQIKPPSEKHPRGIWGIVYVEV